MDVPVAVLAKTLDGGRNDDDNEKRRCRIPFIVWVLFGIIVAILSTAIPSALIFRLSSLDSTDWLTSEVISGTVREATREVQAIVDKHGIVLERISTNNVVRRHIVTEFYDMPSNPEVNNIFLNALKGEVALETTILCGTRANFTGLATLNEYWNLTTIGATYDPKIAPEPFLTWIGYKTGPAYMGAFAGRNGADWAIGPPIIFVAAGANRKTNIEYSEAYIEGNHASLKCYWSKFSSTGVATLICVVPLRVGTDPDIKGTCIFALDPTRGFGMTLDRLQGRLQRTIVIFNENLEPIASSLPVNGIEDFRSREFKGNETSTNFFKFDSVVSSLQTALKTRFLSAPFNTTGNTTLQFTESFNGTQYIIGFASWNVTAYDRWTLAVMAPREQVYGPIDSANQRATIVVVVVTVGVLLTSGAAMFVIVRPLGAVAAAMKRLTNFDFTVLEGGNLMHVNSLVAEIAYIQDTFTTMVRAFAGGIRTNKIMVVGRSSTKADKSEGKVTTETQVRDRSEMY
ncbi:hypothetical protein HK102_013571 [Quaeritorhiza haematococci]|nr:hypothetical protein HK102_013571 [Quaeritorhiza haematococci]